ncbi:hypothetical protein THIOM_000158 [Candidatus Thiomargarita nelsonii]|uniref:Uncharacterized protein n=1 Tax=Candidatus Thiomargarita nelsonii TaxID=1003181 RepID=A0A176S7J3_9GAMM|nr:hypothetical protein THIOM_000158 [Candidatus Thiomargarita nelsonii]
MGSSSLQSHNNSNNAASAKRRGFKLRGLSPVIKRYKVAPKAYKSLDAFGSPYPNCSGGA